MEDIINRSKKIWKVGDDGNVKPVNESGNLMYGKDGKDVLTVDEWAEGMFKNYSYLFESNKGGNAPGSAGVTFAAGSHVIDRNDTDSINNNLENIANGTVIIAPAK